MADPSEGGSTPHETWVTRAPDSSELRPSEAEHAEPIPETITSPTQPAGAGGADRSAERLPLVPGYQILEELGRGGMGVVYKARQLGLNRLVALKMILAGDHASCDDIDRFRAEAEALARLQHPHIIQVYDIDEHAGRPFFSMEYVAGGSLSCRLDGKPMPPREAALLVEMLARAVQAAHEAGIVHRDLKPANVLLEVNDASQKRSSAERFCEASLMPKITDFGLAKRLEEGKGKTRTGDILGTPNYMAPEQAAGRISQIGPATDVHALGAILYECLTGQPPFGKESLLDTLEQVRSHDPAPPRQRSPSVPRDLDVICLKCLRKRPDERYASAGELADDLRRFLDGESIRARAVSVHGRILKWGQRHPVWTALGLLFVAALVGGFVWWRHSERVHPDEEVRSVASSVRRNLFERMYNARTPDGWVRNEVSRDDNDAWEPWAHAQALCAMLRCPEATPGECRQLLRSLDVLQTQPERITRGGIQYGWVGGTGKSYPQAEPILWAASALAAVLARPDLAVGEERVRLERFLAETHAILRTYAPTDHEGGWHIAANPLKLGLQNTYGNILALQTLLDTRKAGLAWDGSAGKRDELIAQTARWLVRTFDANAEPPGWYKDNGSHDRILDGLTLQGYAVLLRAANETDFPLPDGFTAHVRRHLLECGRRKLDRPDESGYVSYPFRRPDGRVDHLVQNLKQLWYPWAIESAVHWLEMARRNGENETQLVDVKRVLGHLVVDLGPQAVLAGESFVFIPAERLYALTSVAQQR